MLLANLVLFILINLVAVYCKWSGCPAPELIKPCVCEDNGAIKCGGHSDIDLVNIFQTLEKNLTKSEKLFNSFHLSNTFINEIKENTFKDITFYEITIENCNNLSKIHINSFNETNLVTKTLNIHSNPKLSSSNNSIFEVISKFCNLESLYFYYNKITEIPINAFQKIETYQDKLTFIRIGGKSINKIGSRPFFSLKGLKYLHLYNTTIDYIPEHAFEFEEESNQTMTVRFITNNLLNGSSFHQDSLTHFKRPVFIDLGWNGNHFEYLEEKTFKNFLSSNSQNQIGMFWQKFDCNDCRNFWLNRNTINRKLRDLYFVNTKLFYI